MSHNLYPGSARGKGTKVDPFTFVPKFTVQRLLAKLPAAQRRALLSNTKGLIGCDASTFQRIRLEPMNDALQPHYRRRSRPWSPDYSVMRNIAKYFAVPMESLYNEAEEPITPQPELPLDESITEKKIQT